MICARAAASSRLLGGEDEAEGLHQEEADGVVQAEEEALRERGEVPLVDEHLERRVKTVERAAPGGGEPDVAVFRTGSAT